MNILIISPMYYIQDRPNLFHDSNAVHYLVKPWAKDNNVLVINIYRESLRKALRYLKLEERNFYKNGYYYSIDNVKVGMCEVLSKYKQGYNLTKKQSERVINFIDDFLVNNSFHPNVIVFHFPSVMTHVVAHNFDTNRKVGILHITDCYACESIDTLEILQNNLDACFARSAQILKYFERKELENLCDNIIYSGVPINTNVKSHSKPNCFDIIYAGKLIKRKNVDAVIYALSYFNNVKFKFSIYGEGPEEKKLKKIAKNLLSDEKIEFHKYINRSELLERMESCDLFIMPSEGETLGLVYLEAMSRGVICIGLKDEGIDGIIKHGRNGYLADPKDLNNSLLSIIRVIFELDSDDYKKISYNSIITGKSFSENDMGYRYYTLITEGI